MVLVIGYGNPLRQDDGAGWQVAERLEALAGAAPNIQAMACHQLTPELAELLSTAGCAIFVDASVEGAPGTVEQRPVTPSTEALDFGAHRFGPAELLTTAQALYGACPVAYLVTIAGQDFGYGERLSAPVAEAVNHAVSLIRRLAHAAGN